MSLREILGALFVLHVCMAGCSGKQDEPAPAATRSLSSTQQTTSEGPRVALVIGNSRYVSSPLTNPENDARLIAKTLTNLGFRVQLSTNSDQKGMKRAIQEFGRALDGGGAGSVGLFYYAGHGAQLNGRNYLIPVDAKIDREADVEIEAVSADWVIEQIRYARNRLNFVILDACRNNPFARSFRSADRGLARMDAPAGVLIAYSTAPGDVAADGDGDNSPYSAALAETMRVSDQPAELMFKQARDTVRRVTADRQTPWESSSLTGQNFYFARALSVAAASPASEPTAPPSSAAATPARTRVDSAPQTTSPVAETGAARPKGSEEDDLGAFMNAPPLFMSNPVCSRAVGQWRVDSDSMQALVRLDAKAGGLARIEGRAQPVKVTWQCNGSDFTFKFEGNVVHTVRIDGEEKLLFGYDEAGVPVTYTR